jgi:hypothetical protein
MITPPEQVTFFNIVTPIAASPWKQFSPSVAEMRAVI